jgi:hypothetical protein
VDDPRKRELKNVETVWAQVPGRVLENSWLLRRTVAVLAADIADNAQINESRGVEAGKLAEHDETRYL